MHKVISDEFEWQKGCVLFLFLTLEPKSNRNCEWSFHSGEAIEHWLITLTFRNPDCLAVLLSGCNLFSFEPFITDTAKYEVLIVALCSRIVPASYMHHGRLYRTVVHNLFGPRATYRFLNLFGGQTSLTL